MAIEMGAKNLAFPADRIGTDYLRSIGITRFEPVWADPDAKYDRVLDYDLATIPPVVAFPHKVDNVKPQLPEAEKEHQLTQCLLGTCTNGRISDIEIAARILRGRHIL